ncbi:MAG TPA: hypothetical protein VER14_00105 [Phototrophicaceae bacterium]|nr:hypothetical protein [Phototrophicaceae bacterium]
MRASIGWWLTASTASNSTIYNKSALGLILVVDTPPSQRSLTGDSSFILFPLEWE